MNRLKRIERRVRINRMPIKFIVELLVNTIPPSLEDSSDDSDSDSEQEYEVVRSRGNISKIHFFVEYTVLGYTEKVFQTHFRMSRRVVYNLLDRCRASNVLPSHPDGREKITAEKSVLLLLWYLANTETFRQISDRFDVSYSSAHRVLLRGLNFVLNLRTEFIKWPNPEQRQKISRGFRRKQGIENVCGAIDGCHVRICKPVEHEDVYVNRHKYHILLLQGTVDHRKIFTDVCCGEPGSIHDARLLRKSALYSKAEGDINVFGDFFLLGDSAYPSLSWLVPPFKDNGALSANQRQFNYKHSSTRIIVEHTFGLLKGRHRRLQYLSNLDIKTAVKIIMASCVLHNICQIENDPTHVDPFNVQDQLDDTPEAWADYRVRYSRREEIFRKMFPQL